MDIKSKKKSVLSDKSVERGSSKYYSILVDELNEKEKLQEFGKLSHRLSEIMDKVAR